jgi:hypothetical protein
MMRAQLSKARVENRSMAANHQAAGVDFVSAKKTKR